MYKTANIEYAKKLYGEATIARALEYIKEGRMPKSIEKRKEVKKVKILLDAMEKYSEAWWLSSNPKVIVKYQMNETAVIVPTKKLITAVNKCFGTNIQTVSEFAEKLPQLQKMSQLLKV